jgi:putative glutathione S-transferase
MTIETQTFSLGSEGDDDGSFKRQESVFRNWVTADGSSGVAPERGRYHLYFARACPWADRTLIGRRLMGLSPVRQASGDDRRQRVGRHPRDAVHRVRAARRAPGRALPGEAARRDRRAQRADLRGRQQRGLQGGLLDPAGGLRARVNGLSQTLDQLDRRLADRRFLFDPEPLETDWRLFATLVRFDAVYQIHFKCSIRKLAEYEHLWPYVRDPYQWPAVAETVDFDEIRAHYYRAHQMINPAGIVAVRPAASFDEPPGRE